MKAEMKWKDVETICHGLFIHLERLRKTCHDNWPPSWDTKWEFPKYETRYVTTTPEYWVTWNQRDVTCAKWTWKPCNIWYLNNSCSKWPWSMTWHVERTLIKITKLGTEFTESNALSNTKLWIKKSITCNYNMWPDCMMLSVKQPHKQTRKIVVMEINKNIMILLV